VLKEIEGDADGAAAAYADLEARWDRWGNVLEAGHAAAGAGRALIRMGRPAEAAHALDRARARFRALGAGALVERLDRVGG